ncbi:MAG: acyl-CoA desaturase [Phycisphaerae bacterium]|nr:acyl-CoA desaturase [Phycisphaerae bacterium]
MHAGCLGVIWVGWSWVAVAVAAFLYFLRMFAITGFYHRYFSHKTFETSRFGQFLLALVGNSAAQRGPIWWASQHRRHHAHSDQPEDPHSPVEHSLYWAHFGWLTVRRNMAIDWRMVPDLAKYPELRFLDRFDGLVPFALGFALFFLGWGLNTWAPSLGTSGFQMLVWGFFISTVVLFHATCTINSLAHWFGSRRYETKDASRNNVFLALLTMGEGWHNNHHRYPGSTRQGFYWWEIDLTYYGLKMLSWVGLIWNLRKVPAHILEQGRSAIANVKAAAGNLTSSPTPASA